MTFFFVVPVSWPGMPSTEAAVCVLHRLPEQLGELTARSDFIILQQWISD